MTIDGKGHLNLTEDEKKISEGIHFHYSGDGDIDIQPTTLLVCEKINMLKLNYLPTYST